MADYAKWRDIEREFRELCNKQPVIRATEAPDGWIVRTNKAERFKSLAGIAAQTASGGSATWNHWLDLLKEWLLETGSDLIDCSDVVSAGGIEARVPAAAKNIYHPKWPKISPDDPRLKRYTLSIVRSVCEASADYCLELARASLQPETHQKLGLSPLPDQSREERLQAFVREHGTTIAAVREAAGCGEANHAAMAQGRTTRLLRHVGTDRSGPERQKVHEAVRTFSYLLTVAFTPHT